MTAETPDGLQTAEPGDLLWFQRGVELELRSVDGVVRTREFVLSGDWPWDRPVQRWSFSSWDELPAWPGTVAPRGTLIVATGPRAVRVVDTFSDAEFTVPPLTLVVSQGATSVMLSTDGSSWPGVVIELRDRLEELLPKAP